MENFLLKNLSTLIFLVSSCMMYSNCTSNKGIEQHRDSEVMDKDQVTNNTSSQIKYKKILNEEKTMTLHVSKAPRTHLIYDFDYYVSDVKTDDILERGTYTGLDVSWHDNTSIKLVPYVGIVQKEKSINPEDSLSHGQANHNTIVKINF